jgi:hypothetical protein
MRSTGNTHADVIPAFELLEPRLLLSTYAEHEHHQAPAYGAAGLMDAHCPASTVYRRSGEVTRAAGNGIQVEPVESTVYVTEGRGPSPVIRLHLTGPPVSPVTVNLSRLGGDTDIAVVTEQVTFNQNNWRADAYVELSAANDQDSLAGQATIRASAAGLEPVDILAYEHDKDGSLGLELREPAVVVTEGRTAIFQVRLTGSPGDTVTVATAWSSGDTDLAVDAHAQLEFDSSNWDRWRWVSISAEDDADAVNGTATFTVSGDGLVAAEVAAEERDDDDPASPAIHDVLVDDYVVLPLQGDTAKFLNIDRLGGNRGEVLWASGQVQWNRGSVLATIEGSQGLAGVWHSLNHLKEEGLPLDLAAVLPGQVLGEYQYKTTAVWVDIEQGSGTFKLELKDPDRLIVWDHTIDLSGQPLPSRFRVPLPDPPAANIQELTWVVDGQGSLAEVSSVGLEVAGPHAGYRAAFLWPYAALLGNYDATTGLTRDRASRPAGDFDAINACGVQAVATALAERLGVISRADARAVVSQTAAAVLDLAQNASWNGVLPRFVRGTDVVVDDVDAVFVGDWVEGTDPPGFYGSGYHRSEAGVGSDTATWNLSFSRQGEFEVLAWWPADASHATNAPFAIAHDGGTSVVRVDQQAGGEWVSLGRYDFSRGTYPVQLSDDANGAVAADAVRVEGPPQIKPGEEFSSIDTCISLLGTLLASEALRLPTGGIEAAISSIDWNALTLEDGIISFGYEDDGTLKPAGWDTFGSEFLMVALMHAASTGKLPGVRYSHPPTANGSGFIDEMLWAFVDSVTIDAWGNHWPAYGRLAAKRQVDYHDGVPANCCGYILECEALGAPVFGSSSGEVPIPSQVPADDTYAAYGVCGRFGCYDGSDVFVSPVAMPHYSGLAWSLQPHAAQRMCDWMVEEGISTPLNSVESLVVQQWGPGLERHFNSLKESWNLGLWTLGAGRWLTGENNPLHAASRTNEFLARGMDHIEMQGFPFSLSPDGTCFLKDGKPVFLNVLAYSPFEPGQDVWSVLNPDRVENDLWRWRGYVRGSDPLVIRLYPRPECQIPDSLYAEARKRDFWVIRDIYFANLDFEDAKKEVDKVIQEVNEADGWDRIFAWEIGNEFTAGDGNVADFVEKVSRYIKQRVEEKAGTDVSRWVTWASWHPNDPLRTVEWGQPILPEGLDFISYNAYPYEPEHLRDHQGGSVTGRPYQGYLEALKAKYEELGVCLPLVVSECGLSDSLLPADDPHDRLHPWCPWLRKGALSPDQAAEGLACAYWDARLATHEGSQAVAGFTLFEWNDEWWKAGLPENDDDEPEEHFGIGRFVEKAPGQWELRYKLQQETVRDVYTLTFTEDIIESVAAVDVGGGQWDVTVTLPANAYGEVRFRWEVNRGCVVGPDEVDADVTKTATAQFWFGDAATYLGPAKVTVVATCGDGRTAFASTEDIYPPAVPGPQDASINILTLGTGAIGSGARASGQVFDVDLRDYKLVTYIETNALYLQPYDDMKSVWIRPDGYWWTGITNLHNGGLRCWLVPGGYDPPAQEAKGWSPPDTIATAWMPAGNDSDNDLLPDADWELLYFGDLDEDRYGDPDADGANNLEELLLATDPTTSGNDSDADGLWDNWEHHFLGTTSLGGGDDPDGDGLTNAQELALALHPGRTAADRDQDDLPDLWERRLFGSLGPDPVAEPWLLDYYELRGIVPGDVNLDGWVDQMDFQTVATNWDPFDTTHVWQDGDSDGDGAIGNSDFAIVLANWDPQPQGGGAAGGGEARATQQVTTLASVETATVGATASADVADTGAPAEAEENAASPTVAADAVLGGFRTLRLARMASPARRTGDVGLLGWLGGETPPARAATRLRGRGALSPASRIGRADAASEGPLPLPVEAVAFTSSTGEDRRAAEPRLAAELGIEEGLVDALQLRGLTLPLGV